MKILVTGAGGFLGSHLVENLVKNNYKVKAFVHYNSDNNWRWLEKLNFKNKIEIISGDIRDFDSVYQATNGVDGVFHLAALIGIPYSYISPLAYIKTNIEGTYNILEASRLLKIKNILIASTSETYGSAQYVPIDELHPMVGQSPYSASKISADNLAVSYYRSFNLPVKIARPFNIYGPRQSLRAIIPTIILQILSGKKIIQLGNVDITRDFTYVSDTVDAIKKIFNENKFNGQYINIGTMNEISIRDLVNKISSILKKKISISQDKDRLRPLKSEVNRLFCDNKKLTNVTNWQPQYNLDRGLKKTIYWLKKNKKLFKSEIYNR
jgi:NAD dependent epimerase/dehydratase